MEKAEGGCLVCRVPYGMSRAGSGLGSKLLLIVGAVAGPWNKCFSAVSFTFSFGIIKWSKEGHRMFQGSSTLISTELQKNTVSHSNL